MSTSNWKPIIAMDASTGGKLTNVNPTEIVVLPECQARVDGTDKALVAEYAADMREYDERIKEGESEYPTHGWQEFPNIRCIHVPDIGHVLISGHHRLKAILDVGYEWILAYSVPGTRQDAIVWSKQQNADNGKRRTNADKAHVVKSCLLDPELKLWSNQTIAKWCGVSPNTVNNHEISLCNLQSENGESYTRPTRRKRLSKSGEIEWIETASIGNGARPEQPTEPAEELLTPAMVEAEIEAWKERNDLPNVDLTDTIEAHRYMSGDRDRQGEPATAEEIKACYERMKDNDIRFVVNAKGEATKRIQVGNAAAEQEAYDALEKLIPRWKEKYASQGYSENELIQAASTAEIIEAYIGYRTKNGPVSKATMYIGNKLTTDGIQDLTELLKSASFPYSLELRKMMTERHPHLVKELKRQQDTETESPKESIELESAHDNAKDYRRRVWIAFGESDISKSISKEDFALAAAKQHGLYEEADYGSGENYLLGKDYAPIDLLNLKQAQEMRAFFNSVRTAIRESADWVLALHSAGVETDETDEEVSDTTENDVISEARAQVTEIINGLDAPKSTNGATNGAKSNYRLEYLSIGLRDADGNSVSPLKFQLIASRQLDEHPLTEVPDALKVELLKLVERLKHGWRETDT